MRFQLAGFALTRTVINTAYRMLYPFLPALARGLGVDLQAIALIATARFSLGLAAPLYGSLGDTWGRRTAMLAGLGLISGGLLLVGFWPAYLTLFAAMLLVAVGKSLFDTSMQAHLGDSVPYQQRGLAIAVTEMGWSGAFLIGMPVLGFMMAGWGWSSPFLWLGLIGLALMVLIGRAVPQGRAHSNQPIALVEGVRIILSHPAALAGLAVGFLISAGNELVSIIFGAWLEDSFALKVAALGLASMVIGVAELSGEGMVALVSDRFGKRRMLIGGVIASGLTCLALPLLSGNLMTALIGLFLVYLTFEFTLVVSIPLMTELVPGARATLMAANVAALSSARALGAALGPLLFSGGLIANGLVAAGFNGLAVIVLILFVKIEE
jgi:predicted MFS family arabinose efflux permease